MRISLMLRARVVCIIICLLMALIYANAQNKTPLPVIFETDMGNDVDDALALDLLYKYHDEGRIQLLGISNNKNSDYSIPFLQLMNDFYGYPNIPLGNVHNGANSAGDALDYTKAVVEYSLDSVAPFDSYKYKTSSLESVLLYRKILSAQADSSVVLISVGFSTNLVRLLDSKSDAYSSLNGADLVAKKIKYLSVMACTFTNNWSEYNIQKDTTAARRLFSEWPTKIIVSPYEVGAAILYPASSIENDLDYAKHHPLKIAYSSYMKMPYDRPTWDLTAVLFAAEGPQDYFSLSEHGVVSVLNKGNTTFTANANGRHQYLRIDNAQAKKIRERFIELIQRKPKSGSAIPSRH